MTEREKMIEVIAPYVSAYGDDEAIANALIAAGIGDVTAYKAEAEYWEKICKFESDEHHTAIKNAAEHARHLMQERDEYKHRAEVAEKDLERHKRALYCACKASTAVLSKELVKARVDCFLRKAEREIKEECGE